MSDVSTENLSLEELVKKVDYKSLNEGYVPSQFAIKFVNFIKLVNGGQEENKTPIFHYDLLDTISKYKNNLIIAFRGSSKTTLSSEYLFLYIATFGELDGFGDVSVAMYVGDTMDNGCKNLRKNIEHRYYNSEFLKKFIPQVHFTDTSLEFTNADGHKFFVKMFGATTGVRGVKVYGKRPSLAVLDDLFTDKAAESKTIINDIENIIYKAVRQALHPTKRKVIWIGTAFSKADPLYKGAGTKEWHTKVYPICERFPCDKKDFVGAWEDRFPYDMVRSEYNLLKSQGKVDAFNQELMLRILSDDDRLVLDEDIVWYPRNNVLYNTKDYNFYITSDFATSEKEGSDYSVIAVWALDHTGRFHWVDGIVNRQDMAKNVDDIFRLVTLYNPLSVGVEISGQQKGFVSWLQRDMQTRGIWFNLASDKSSGEPGIRPTTSKLVRFNNVLPLFKQRKIAFPEELRESKIVLEYIDELTSITPTGCKSLHDDCMDAVSQLQLLWYVNPHNPSESTSVVEKDSYYDYSPSYWTKEEKEPDGDSYIV
jgi:predicted phage terminase large subunit-like protein